LYKLLSHFYTNNPNFGRKQIKVAVNTQYNFVKKQNVKITTKTVSFNTKYIPYHIMIKGGQEFVEPVISHDIIIREDNYDIEPGEEEHADHYLVE